MNRVVSPHSGAPDSRPGAFAVARASHRSVPVLRVGGSSGRSPNAVHMRVSSVAHSSWESACTMKTVAMAPV